MSATPPLPPAFGPPVRSGLGSFSTDSCSTKVTEATTKLFDCLARASLTDTDETSSLISRCGCYNSLKTSTEDCEDVLRVNKGAVLRDFFEAQADEKTMSYCKQLWSAWDFRDQVHWWESSELRLCIFLVVVVLLVTCLWIYRDVVQDIVIDREEAVEDAVQDVKVALHDVGDRCRKLTEEELPLPLLGLGHDEAKSKQNREVDPDDETGFC
eukprot:s17_g45.t1